MPVCCVLAWPHVLQGGAFTCAQLQPTYCLKRWTGACRHGQMSICTLVGVCQGATFLAITVSIAAGMGAWCGYTQTATRTRQSTRIEIKPEDKEEVHQ